MSIVVLEKAKRWLKMNHEDDILMISRLNDLVMVIHIQYDLPLLIALMERWNPNMNTFHLPPCEMNITLLNVYIIWGIPICGRFVHHIEVGIMNTTKPWQNG